MYRKHHKCHILDQSVFTKKLRKLVLPKLNMSLQSVKNTVMSLLNIVESKKEDIINTLLPFSMEKGSFLSN